MLINFISGFLFKAQYYSTRDSWYIKYVPSSSRKSVGRNNNASYNIGAYTSSDAAKADFTRLTNHLLDGKKYLPLYQL